MNKIVLIPLFCVLIVTSHWWKFFFKWTRMSGELCWIPLPRTSSSDKLMQCRLINWLRRKTIVCAQSCVSVYAHMGSCLCVWFCLVLSNFPHPLYTLLCPLSVFTEQISNAFLFILPCSAFQSVVLCRPSLMIQNTFLGPFLLLWIWHVMSFKDCH